MTGFPVDRRKLLKTLGLTAGIALIRFPAAAADQKKEMNKTFGYSLNMSTLRGHKLGFIRELQTASKAGFRSVEIWMDVFQTYLQQGGSAREAGKIIAGLGLQVENAIGFAPWLADDEAIRNAGLRQLQAEMELLAELGCRRIAAPPAGANSKNAAKIDLDLVTERYRTILLMGEKTGVMPILEMWGSSTNLKKISEVLYVAAESGHRDARVLLDIFHIFKGGSDFGSLAFVGKAAVDIIHINDYPAGIPPAKISEPDRIYPGDGIAPLRDALTLIRNPDKPVILSLEVFNESYYRQDPLLVARTGLAKMMAVTEGL